MIELVWQELIVILEYLRLLLIKNLFKDDEKYLLQMALEDRGNKLRGLYGEKHVDIFYLRQDMEDVNKLKKLFSTEYYK